MDRFLEEQAELATKRLIFALNAEDDVSEEQTEIIRQHFESAVREAYHDGWSRSRQALDGIMSEFLEECG